MINRFTDRRPDDRSNRSEACILDAIVGQIVCQTGQPDDRLVYTYFRLAQQPVGRRIALKFDSCDPSANPSSNSVRAYTRPTRHQTG